MMANKAKKEKRKREKKKKADKKKCARRPLPSHTQSSSPPLLPFVRMLLNFLLSTYGL